MLRRELLEESDSAAGPDAGQSLPVQAYTVIQQLKQQKFELQNEQQVQRRRAKTSEHITAAIIANLPCGTLFVAPNGIVRQANAAARTILGLASPIGMSIMELLRENTAVDDAGRHTTLIHSFEIALEGKAQSHALESSYLTPSNETRFLEFTLVPVFEPGGKVLGLAALISDHTELASAREDEILRKEEAAEMALELRSSLATIREWAEQVGAADDAKLAQTFAVDIYAETERLEKTVGTFLSGKKAAKAAHA
jgi:PAS domain-containing protein